MPGPVGDTRDADVTRHLQPGGTDHRSTGTDYSGMATVGTTSSWTQGRGDHRAASHLLSLGTGLECWVFAFRAQAFGSLLCWALCHHLLNGNGSPAPFWFRSHREELPPQEGTPVSWQDPETDWDREKEKGGRGVYLGHWQGDEGCWLLPSGFSPMLSLSIAQDLRAFFPSASQGFAYSNHLSSQRHHSC